MATAYGIADRVVLLDGRRIVIDAPPAAAFAIRDPRIEPFAISSGVEPARLVPHAHRKTPAEIRAVWSARRSAIESDASSRRAGDGSLRL